jgi:DNA-binding CsgD family transcriptional regulator
MPPLTPREKDVLAQVRKGNYTNKEIAQALRLSPRTVEIHKANLMHKMHARNSARLVFRALSLKETT